MPELPDIVVYLEHLHERIAGQTLERVRLANPFLLRSVEPPIRELEGRGPAPRSRARWDWLPSTFLPEL